MKRSCLFLLPSDLMGGAEFNLLKCARFLSGKEHSDVTVVFLSKREENISRWDELENVKFIYIPAKRESLGALYFTFYSYLYLNKEYDYCFTSHTHCNAFSSILVLLKVIKVKKLILRESTNVFSWFNGYKKKMISFFYLLYSRKATIICQTEKMKTELLSNVPAFNKLDVKVVTNPVEIKSLRMLSAEYEIDNSLIRKGAVTIVSVGRLVEEKSYDILINSVANLSFDFELYLIGSGELEQELRRQTESLNISQKVKFLGNVVNPFPYMVSADLCVVSSKLEGFPNVLLEMMTLSSRVISTLCADGIQNIPGIFTCKINDSDSLCLKIEEAMQVNDVEIKRRKEEMELYVEKLDIKTFVNKILI
jgi:glycosyltransferase involved in cell wall biosynthesis